MNYELKIADKARKHIQEFKKSDTQSYKKVQELFRELMVNPTEGTGNPKTLKGNYSKYWSRRINKKDRLIYKIENEEISVYIISAKGHYDDK